jgi:hypothetical protein
MQPFFLVNPVSSFVIVRPALTPQQDLNPLEAVPNARLGYLSKALPYRSIVAAMLAVTLDGARQQHRRTGFPFRDPILRQQHARQLAPLPAPQSFFFKTS